MPRYTFKGDTPRSSPEYGFDYVAQGDIVEAVQEIDHPDFELIPEKAPAKAETKTENKTETAPAATSSPAKDAK